MVTILDRDDHTAKIKFTDYEWNAIAEVAAKKGVPIMVIVNQIIGKGFTAFDIRL